MTNTANFRRRSGVTLIELLVVVALMLVLAGLAVAVSQSTGTVTVFRNGKIVTELEKPRPGRARAGGRGPRQG